MTDEIKLNEINLREEALWGARNIAKMARVSVDRVYDWAKIPDCPIFQPDGKQYFVIKSEFMRWLRRKKGAPLPHLPDVASISPD